MVGGEVTINYREVYSGDVSVESNNHTSGVALTTVMANGRSSVCSGRLIDVDITQKKAVRAPHGRIHLIAAQRVPWAPRAADPEPDSPPAPPPVPALDVPEGPTRRSGFFFFCRGHVGRVQWARTVGHRRRQIDLAGMRLSGRQAERQGDDRSCGLSLMAGTSLDKPGHDVQASPLNRTRGQITSTRGLTTSTRERRPWVVGSVSVNSV